MQCYATRPCRAEYRVFTVGAGHFGLADDDLLQLKQTRHFLTRRNAGGLDGCAGRYSGKCTRHRRQNTRMAGQRTPFLLPQNHHIRTNARGLNGSANQLNHIRIIVGKFVGRSHGGVVGTVVCRIHHRIGHANLARQIQQSRERRGR